jgi:hypothetical protein
LGAKPTLVIDFLIQKNMNNMKKMIYSMSKFLLVLVGISLMITSCNYKEYADADYPEQRVYLTTAYDAIYDISVSVDRAEVPTPGSTYRYIVEGENLIVPLGVYRSGVTNEGAVSVSVAAVEDAVTSAIDDGTLAADTELLASDKYSFSSSVVVADGKDVVTFNLTINLDYIKSVADKKYAVAIGIASSDREVNPDLSTTIVFIDTALLEL